MLSGRLAIDRRIYGLPNAEGRGVVVDNLQDDKFHGVAERNIQQSTDCVT